MAEEAEKKLYDIVVTGDAASFRQMLQEDPCVLDRASYVSPNKTTPLHIAALYGNLGIVQEVLHRNQHYMLPKMCWQRDSHGMNPVHIAAINGNVEILKELIGLDPSPAREKVDRGQTVLHLCVKHGNLDALKVMLESFPELVRAEDDDGDTILHFAARCMKYEIVQYLVENNIIEKGERNSKGTTAMGILMKIPPNETTSKIKCILGTPLVKATSDFFKTFRDIGMVVSVLIATMAFQAVVSPPGGVWQDDSPAHKAGSAVMAYTHPNIYKHFIRANTVAFACSLIVILLLTTVLSSVDLLVTMAVTYTMCVSLASIAVSYGASILVIGSNTETDSISSVIFPVVTGILSIMFGLPWVYTFFLETKSKLKKFRFRNFRPFFCLK